MKRLCKLIDNGLFDDDFKSVKLPDTGITSIVKKLEANPGHLLDFVMMSESEREALINRHSYDSVEDYEGPSEEREYTVTAVRTPEVSSVDNIGDGSRFSFSISVKGDAHSTQTYTSAQLVELMNQFCWIRGSHRDVIHALISSLAARELLETKWFQNPSVNEMMTDHLKSCKDYTVAMDYLQYVRTCIQKRVCDLIVLKLRECIDIDDPYCDRRDDPLPFLRKWDLARDKTLWQIFRSLRNCIYVSQFTNPTCTVNVYIPLDSERVYGIEVTPSSYSLVEYKWDATVSSDYLELLDFHPELLYRFNCTELYTKSDKVSFHLNPEITVEGLIDLIVEDLKRVSDPIDSFRIKTPIENARKGELNNSANKNPNLTREVIPDPMSNLYRRNVQD